MKQLKMLRLFLYRTLDPEKLVEMLPPRLLMLLARLLAQSRPLGLYPGWQFDVAWYKSYRGARFRRAIWQHYNNHKQQPIVIKWISGLRVKVYLGNDLSLCLYIDGCFEPNEFVFLDNVLAPGMTFIDGGTNAGLYTLFASRRVGPTGLVMAIEPSQREFNYLQDNLKLNKITNVKAFQIALSNKNDTGTLHIARDDHEGQNTLGIFAHPDIKRSHTEQVSLRRLDDLIDEEKVDRVDVIKLDVEGAESKALEGAHHILHRFSPLLLIELSDAALRSQGSSSSKLLGLIKSLGYEIYTFDRISGEPVRANKGDKLSDNIIAAHPNKTWSGLTDTPLPKEVS